MLTFESKKDIPFLVFSDKLEDKISEQEMEENNIGEFKNNMEDKEIQALVKQRTANLS